MPSLDFADLPVDVLSPILEALGGNRDLCACALVNRTFNRSAIPLLYRTLTAGNLVCDQIRHPSSTLLDRPELAQHVQHVTEDGAIHRRFRYGSVTQDAVKALSLCTSLRSLTWHDNCMSPSYEMLPFISILQGLPKPLEALEIRTHTDLPQGVWNEIHKISGLRKVSIWSMEGPPRVLQGWGENLGHSLTHLELARCAGVPPTIIISVLLHLPHLLNLRLKGAPASAIHNIIAILPNLKVLDTDYLPSTGRSRGHRKDDDDDELPALEELTVRASTADCMGEHWQHMWAWIRDLIPGPDASLVHFSLHAFIMDRMGKPQAFIPRNFLLDIANVHGETLVSFPSRGAQLRLRDIELLCELCPKLEVLSCSTVVGEDKLDLIKDSISSARNLRSLTLQVDWVPGGATSPFTIEHAVDWMLRREGAPRLRSICINETQFTGTWVLASEDLPPNSDSIFVTEVKGEAHKKFIVAADVAISGTQCRGVV